MQTKKELEKELVELNEKIEASNKDIREYRDKALRIAGKIELLEEQEESKK